MATPYVGTGCVIQVYIAAAYVTIASVRDISAPSMKTTSIDTSSRASLARTFAPGMVDPGELVFDIVYDPDADSHAAGVAGGLVKLEKDGTVCNWQLLFPVATTITGCSFSGFVTKLDIKTPMDGAMTADLTIKISGAVTWA